MINAAVSGAVAVVGAWGADPAGSGSGAAYILERQSDGAWTQTKVVAADGAWRDYFGYSVAVSGAIAVVGAFLAVRPARPPQCGWASGDLSRTCGPPCA